MALLCTAHVLRDFCTMYDTEKNTGCISGFETDFFKSLHKMHETGNEPITSAD